MPKLAVVLVLTPEPVPPFLSVVVAKSEIVLEGKIAETGSYVDVHLRAQIPQQRLDSRVFLEGLSKRSDGVLDCVAHLRVQLRKTTRFESLVNPRLVGFKIELGPSDQKITRPESIERFEPTRRLTEVLLECSDVRRFWSDDPPSEDSNPFAHDACVLITLPSPAFSPGLYCGRRFAGSSDEG